MAAPSAPSVAARRLPRRARRAPPPPVRHGLRPARPARCCARRSPRWYTARGTPTTPDQILVTTGAQQAIHLLVTRARRPRRPRGRRAPDLPARDRRRARRRCPARARCRRAVPVWTSTCSSRPCGRSSPAARLPDPRPPQPDRDQPRRRRARRGPRPGPPVPHDDRRRRGADRADHGRTGARLVRRRRHGVGLRRLDRLGVQDASGAACGSAGSARTPTWSPGWPARARTSTSARPCWSSWSWPSCSRSRPTCSTPSADRAARAARPAGRPAARPAAVLALRRARGRAVAVGRPRRAGVQRARRDLDPARRPGRARHGVRGGRQLRAEPAAAVHHVPRRPAPRRRRAGGRLGGPRHHRSRSPDPTGCTRWC